MKKYNFFFWAFTLLLFTLSSCTKYLDVKPDDRFLADQVFENEASINTALNGIYLNLAKPALYGGQMTMSTVDVLAQYHNYTGVTQRYYNYGKYTYTDLTVQTSFSTIWAASYRAILNVNSFISQLKNSDGVISADKSQILMGEAYAIRAYLHLDMLRLFGPVYLTDSTKVSIPYFTTPTEKIQPLLAANKVMDNVITDLALAGDLLKNDPIRTEGVTAITGTDVLTDFYKLRNRRFNYYAVMAIKARALLYRNNKSGALAAAKSVITEGGKWFPWSLAAKSLPGATEPDRNFSSEVILGVQNADMYTQQSTLFAATLATNVILAPTSVRLLEIYESNENDYRYRVNWISAASAEKSYRVFVKYDDILNKAAVFRNFQTLFRMSELYYIAAECEPDQTLAIAYLNETRRNRGLVDLGTTAVMATELTKEYRKEFLGEGQTFFYYKRKNTASILSGIATTSVAMNALKYVVPLPLSETQNR